MATEMKTKITLMVQDAARSGGIGRAAGDRLALRSIRQDGVGTDAR